MNYLIEHRMKTHDLSELPSRRNSKSNHIRQSDLYYMQASKNKYIQNKKIIILKTVNSKKPFIRSLRQYLQDSNLLIIDEKLKMT